MVADGLFLFARVMKMEHSTKKTCFCFVLMIFFVLLWRKNVLMGTMSQKIKDMQSKRIAYQKEKTKEYMARVASYLSVEDQKILYSGNGFVEVPEEERHRERIDAYPYLIP